MADKRAIGVFDSGIGGMTVVSELMRLLPHEKVIYFGDTARLPYGTKSKETIQKFSRQIVRFLRHFPVKMIVAACNTASADALPSLQKDNEMPIIGVIEPGALAGIRATSSGRVGVIGTRGTISSGAYQKALFHLKADVDVIAQPCPLFVPLVEENWLSDPVTRQITERYLARLIQFEVDTVILGCTHYPLLKPIINTVLGLEVILVDSATETATQVKQTLSQYSLLTSVQTPPHHQFFVSDYSVHFQALGERCLGHPLNDIIQIDLDEFEQSGDPTTLMSESSNH